MSRKARFIREGDIGVLRIDNPPVNALSRETVESIAAAFELFEAQKELAGLVIECAGRTFVAGGDIASFEAPDFSAVPFNTLLARMEASDRPVAAALFGTVLGGGLELALACHLRIAAADTQLGLPEIRIGLIPGSLGTQRLPRLIGLKAAARMILEGAPVTAAEAVSSGLVDRIARDPSAAAREAVREAVSSNIHPRRTSGLSVPDAGDAGPLLARLKADGASQPHLPAIAAAADALEAAATRPFEEGEKTEAAAFSRLVHSPSSRALRHIFFAERAARRIPGLQDGVAPRAIRSVGVLGVGTMGAGISMAFANAGIPVTMVETSEEALARGRGIIARTYAAAVARGRIGEDEAAARQARLSGGTDIAALADRDLVVEAVFEDMTLKMEVAAGLGRVCKPGAIIATNTSTLDVDRIAAASGRPGDVIGTHFFSPAHIMRLLEVVRGERTAPDVLRTAMSLAQRIGKTAVVSGVCHGFIGNRMAEVYARENEAMQLEGASPAQIDGVAEDKARLGMAMGPSRMLDMAGVDVGARTVIEWVRSGEGPQEPSYRALSRALYEAGHFGQKTGEGFCRYEGRTPLPSENRSRIAAELADRHGVKRRDDISAQEIFERLLYPMVNEAALILQEGIAFRPGDIDVVWTAGYGFPAWRGGPVFMADEIGLSRIVARLDHHADTLGNAEGHWTVAPLLRDLAGKGGRLGDWRPEAERIVP